MKVEDTQRHANRIYKNAGAVDGPMAWPDLSADLTYTPPNTNESPIVINAVPSRGANSAILSLPLGKTKAHTPKRNRSIPKTIPNSTGTPDLDSGAILEGGLRITGGSACILVSVKRAINPINGRAPHSAQSCDTFFNFAFRTNSRKVVPSMIRAAKINPEIQPESYCFPFQPLFLRGGLGCNSSDASSILSLAVFSPQCRQN